MITHLELIIDGCFFCLICLSQTSPTITIIDTISNNTRIPTTMDKTKTVVSLSEILDSQSVKSIKIESSGTNVQHLV